MPVKVQIPPTLRQHTDNQAVVEACGATVQALLEDLKGRYPALGGRLYSDGKLKPFINLFLNDEDVRYLDGLASAVKDGDELAIIPPVAGG
jgi:MoaD family protein